MPYTLNGIGTRYVGRSNHSVVSGVCPFCSRPAHLSYYDTREFFVVLFIPVVPLRKFRIQGDCSSCRKHYRVPHAEFRTSVATHVDPLREAAERSPRDEAAHAAHAQALVEHRMLGEAEEACRAGLGHVPDSPRLNEMLGGLLAARGDYAAALPPRQKSAALSPKSHAARLALGRTFVVLGRNEEAVRELLEARRLDPSDALTLRLLADAQLALSRFSEALQTYEELFVRHPEAKDAETLRNVKRCKETLGFSLSPEEKKAGRRWWPFGRRVRPLGAAPRARQTDWKRIGIGLAAVLGLGAAAVAALAFWRQGHVDLYIDSGLKEPVTVAIDGKALEPLVGPPRKVSVAPGTHRISARSRSAEIESFDARVEGRSLLESLFEGRFYVYDVNAVHIYRRARVSYSASSATAPPPEETYIGLSRFFSQEKADYVFRDAPETIQMDAHAAVESRVVFNVAADVDYGGLGVLRYREGKAEEAEKDLRKAIELVPCGADARENLGQLLGVTGHPEKAVAEEQAWLTACPASIAAHRAHQNRLLEEGRRAELLADYRARLGENGAVGTAHYLYGRLLKDPDEAAREYEQAVGLDPKLTWGHVALAHLRLAAERYPDALSEFEAALKAPDVERRVVTGYSLAAIGAGSGEQAVRFLRERSNRLGEDDFLKQARWNLLLAGKSWDAAKKELDGSEKAEGNSADVFTRRAQLLSLTGKDADLEKLLARSCARKELAAPCQWVRFEIAMGAGRYREAADLLADPPDAAGGSDASPFSRLYRAAALLLAGDRAGGEACAREALEALKSEKEPSLLDSYAGALLRKMEPAALLADARRQDFLTLKHAYFFLGARAAADGKAAAAGGHFKKSESLALDSEFPLLAARMLAWR